MAASTENKRRANHKFILWKKKRAQRKHCRNISRRAGVHAAEEKALATTLGRSSRRDQFGHCNLHAKYWAVVQREEQIPGGRAQLRGLMRRTEHAGKKEETR